MSHRTPFPPSPGLPPSLYSGISSLQISQAGPVSIEGASFHSHTSQPQKALLKGHKTARQQSRKSEHPSSPAPWKDPRQAVAASAGHKRTVKDDVFYRNIQHLWSPFPPDARPATHKERDIMLCAVTDHVVDRQTKADIFYSGCERRVSVLEEQYAAEAEYLRELRQDVERVGQRLDERDRLRRAQSIATRRSGQDRTDNSNRRGC